MTVEPDGPADRRDPQTYALIGAAMEVHRELGPGFLEPVYQEAMARELAWRGIPCAREMGLAIWYKHALLPHRYRVDFICFGEVLVELKALGRITGAEEARLIHYLKASRLCRGLLLNFGAPSLQYKRFVGPGPVAPPAARRAAPAGR